MARREDKKLKKAKTKNCTNQTSNQVQDCDTPNKRCK